jgi:hypothetical protein
MKVYHKYQKRVEKHKKKVAFVGKVDSDCKAMTAKLEEIEGDQEAFG